MLRKSKSVQNAAIAPQCFMGIGDHPNKQKHRFCENGIDAFACLYIRTPCLLTLCQIWYNRQPKDWLNTPHRTCWNSGRIWCVIRKTADWNWETTEPSAALNRLWWDARVCSLPIRLPVHNKVLWSTPWLKLRKRTNWIRTDICFEICKTHQS